MPPQAASEAGRYVGRLIFPYLVMLRAGSRGLAARPTRDSDKEKPPLTRPLSGLATHEPSVEFDPVVQRFASRDILPRHALPPDDLLERLDGPEP